MSRAGWLGGLTGINIILSDHPLYSSHQHIQTNRGAECTARVEIETWNSRHTTFTLPRWRWNVEREREEYEEEGMVKKEWLYKTVGKREERQEKKKESQWELLALLCVWSEDLQACSGVSVWVLPSGAQRGRGKIKEGEREKSAK